MNSTLLYYALFLINSIICNSYTSISYNRHTSTISTISSTISSISIRRDSSSIINNMMKQLKSTTILYNNNIINDINNDINNNINKNIKIDINYDDNDNDNIKTINEEIYDIIQLYIKADANGDLFKVDPSILTQNGHILTQGRIYEDIIKELLNNCITSEQTLALERVDNFLNGYIKTERKSRSRLKVNYILAGASSNRFEESILLLSECDEIDEDLIDYLDGLVKKAMMNSNGPLGMIDFDDSDFEGTTVTIDILRMIQRRLLTEKSTKGNTNLRLLGQLLNEPSAKLRESLVSETLNTMESIDSFTQFVKDGIDHISKRPVDEDEKNSASPEISDDTLEKMKDIIYSVDKLFKKLKIGTSDNENEDVFSTSDMEDDENE